MKKAIGVGAVGCGSIGILLCLIGVIAIWSLHREATTRLLALYDNAEKGLLITGVSLNRMAPQLKWMQDEYGRHLADVPVEEVATTFHEVGALLDASLANTETAVSVIYLFPLWLFVDLDDAEWETAVSDLTQITTAVDTLAELSMASKEEDTVAANLITIDKQYTQLTEQLQTIIPKISAMRKVVFGVKEQLPQWISRISILATILLIWIAVGQLALLKWGAACLVSKNNEEAL